MENLWAPWRSDYIDTCSKPVKTCIFCKAKKEKKDRENLILYRGKLVFVIMNRFPYNNGHLMVVPYHHTGDIAKLTKQENCDVWETVILCKKILNKAYCPQGFNIGMNLGRAAGAGIDTHCHAHIIPRWNGDTNFMPIVGKVKVLSEDLYKSFDRLKALF